MHSQSTISQISGRGVLFRACHIIWKPISVDTAVAAAAPKIPSWKGQQQRKKSPTRFRKAAKSTTSWAFF